MFQIQSRAGTDSSGRSLGSNSLNQKFSVAYSVNTVTEQEGCPSTPVPTLHVCFTYSFIFIFQLTADIKQCVSFRCIAQWPDIYIACEVIPPISLYFGDLLLSFSFAFDLSEIQHTHQHSHMSYRLCSYHTASLRSQYFYYTVYHLSTDWDCPSVIADAFLSRFVSRLCVAIRWYNCVSINQYPGALIIVCLDIGQGKHSFFTISFFLLIFFHFLPKLSCSLF